MEPPAAAALSPLDWAGDDCDDGDEGLGFLALEAERSDETLEVRLDEGLTVVVRGYARDCGQTLKCTGLTSWRGGENLARWLYQQRAELRARTCLELGAGLGLCSIVVEQCCTAVEMVVATDGDVLSLDALRHNVPTAVRVRELRWGVASHESALLAEFSGAFDLVVAADVIYDALAVVPLVETVLRLLAPAGTFVLSFTRRGVDLQQILDAALRAGLVYSNAPDLEALDIPSTERLLVFTFAGQREGAVSAGP